MAGEAIFMLPFLLPRLLRPLMLEAWSITNTDLGLAFSAYGVSSLFSYLFGGALADKYSPKKLISISLLATGIGGIGMLLSPDAKFLIVLYFYFGVSTTFLLWGALIKLTHLNGGKSKRASAMGLLDSGRGLFAAIMSSLMLFVISQVSLNSLNASSYLESLNKVIIILIFVVFTIALLVWFGISDPKRENKEKEKWSLNLAIKVLKKPVIWLQGVIILCAYCGFKNIDNYSVYLVDAHQFSILKASQLTSIILWIRPLSTLVFGVFADYLFIKYKNARFGVIIFLFILSGFLNLLLGLNLVSNFSLVFTSILMTVGLTFALRSLYFAIFDELNIPNYLVGTSVGIISVLGFLPDMFFGVITGNIIDTMNAGQSYSIIFILMSIVLFVGALASILNMKMANKS